MTTNLNVFENSKKEIAFYPNQFFLLQKFIGRYIGSDKNIKILTIWSKYPFLKGQLLIIVMTADYFL